MARRLTPRSRRWLQWVSGVLLIAAGCAQSLAAIAAPQVASGQARIWFYNGYDTRRSTGSVPSIVVNGSYVAAAPPGTVFYRDVLPGHYDITIPDPHGFKHQSAQFDLAVGQQAYIKIIRVGLSAEYGSAPGFGALLVPEQVAQAEFANSTPDGGQR